MAMKVLPFDAYMDKVMGGWYGKCLGGTVGCFEGTKRITHLKAVDMLPDTMIPNDDLDMQLIWMDVILQHGIHFTQDQMMQAWLEAYPYNFGEYSVARRNFRRGLHGDACGAYANYFFHDGMGCPIRSDIWGLIAPGNPELAAAYARQDGLLDHDGESVYAEQFLSAMTSEAFFEKDLRVLIDQNLRFFPDGCVTRKAVSLAIADYDRGLSWQETWTRLRNRFGHPDNTYAPLNLGFLVMALLHGHGDMEETLDITLNAAWDVDCTCSSAAALLGVICGYQALGEPWKSHVGTGIKTFATTCNAMNDIHILSWYTAQAAMTLQHAGNLIGIDPASFPTELPPLPCSDHQDSLTFSVDYQGKPAISAYQSKKISIMLHAPSHRKESICVSFSQIPQVMDVQPTNAVVMLDEHGRGQCHVTVKVKAGTPELPDTNLFTVQGMCAGTVLGRMTFGLCGMPCMLMSEPFYDTYMEWLDVNRLPKERLIRAGQETVIVPCTSDEYSSHRADLDKAYLPEHFAYAASCRTLFGNGERISIADDLFSVKDAYGLEGPVCVYHYMEVIPPEAEQVDLFIGSTDPFILFLNGEEILRQESNRFYYPYQDIRPVFLKEGINTLVIKIARKGADNLCSIVFRKKNETFAFDGAPVLTDLKYSIL